MSRWMLDVDDRGKIDVFRNGRAVAYDVDDFDEVFALIKKHRGYHKGDRIVVIDANGDQRRITSL